MAQPQFPILTAIVFLPLLGATIIALLPRHRERAIKGLAFAIGALVFLASLPLFIYFNATSEMQFVEHRPWVPQLGISYHLGIDGISLFLVLLTTLLSSLAILSSWKAIKERVKEYMILMLLLETGMLGVFSSLDLVLFYIFWEATLVPMYLLIGIWGGERRIYATMKFVLYTMVGSVLMLVAIMALYFLNHSATGNFTFDLLALQGLGLAQDVQVWLFLAFFLAFAIKVPLFPFHTWLPDAHVEAPTAGSIILAGILLKMGAYGFLRFALPLFPEAGLVFVPVIALLSLIGIIYGALVAWAQRDLKRLVAYSSVSHLGFVMLGVFVLNPQGLSGAVLQMVNHGLSTGALFLIVGILYERRHSRLIADYGGIWKSMPFLGILFLIVTLSSLGLPGLNGFVGEFLVLVGAFRFQIVYAVVAGVGVVLAAVYLLSMFRRVMLGPLDKAENRELKDLSVREGVILLVIVALIFLIGLYPQPFLSRIEPSVQDLITQVEYYR